MTRIVLSNEFASVVVEVVATRNGERLRILSPARGREILLDPVELDVLTGQDHSLFTSLLQHDDDG